MLHTICWESTGGVFPDLTIFYKPEDPVRALKRGTEGREADRMEKKGEEFHGKVYRMYYEVLPGFLKEREGRRIEIIDSTPEIGIERVHKETKRIVGELVVSRGLLRA